jgi:dolichol-phosphate mannosyltransferase
MLKKLFQNQVFRFLICGIVTAAFNIFLLAIMIEFLKLDQPLLRNIANLISIEISLLFSFFVYRAWVWSKGKWVLRDIFRRQIPLYHLSCGSVIAIRSLILFPILDWFHVNYIINSMVGIIIGSTINYVVSDRLVFKVK